MQVEDGYVLGKLFSHLTHPDQIPIFFNGFHQIRHKRKKDTQASEIQSLFSFTAPPGPRRDRWVEGLKAGEGAESDAQFMEAYQSWIQAFDYDANEAVDEWWLAYGQFAKNGMAALNT